MPQHAVPSILVKGDNLQATPIHFENHLPAAGGQRRRWHPQLLENNPNQLWNITAIPQKNLRKTSSHLNFFPHFFLDQIFVSGFCFLG